MEKPSQGISGEKASFQAQNGLQWSRLDTLIQNLDDILLLLLCIKNAQISYHVYVMANIQSLMGV